MCHSCFHRAGFNKPGMGKTPYILRHVFYLIVRVVRGIMTEKITTQTWEPAGKLVQFEASPSRRILVVADEPDLCRLNAEVLKDFGYHVDTAKDGVTGWKALHVVRHAPESYDLLITDHDMSGLSGLALVKKVRAARIALPVIMASGRLSTDDLFIRYPWLTPAATLAKPYSIEQLLGTVKAVLRMASGIHEQIKLSPN